MSDKRKICVVTGSRADYGLLYWLMKDIEASSRFKLQLVVTGMHLSPEFGLTAGVIEADGFKIDARVESLLSSDTAVGVTKSVGLGVIGFADVYERLHPDLVLVLGDRFEIFAAAQAALFARVPIAHIGGGDVTEGAFDEAIRHSISKMANLHFVTNRISARRLEYMGENPDHVFVVGSPGLDHLHRNSTMDRASVEKELDFRFRDKNFLITFHPVTLDKLPSTDQLKELFCALDQFAPDIGMIFTMPNADTEGRELIQHIEKYVAGKDHARAYTSLGQKCYLGTMAIADVVIGNSSSGLYEAPALRTPTVNIGMRQHGRLKASSVFDCAPERGAIAEAISNALSFGNQAIENPYQQGDSAKLMLDALSGVDNYSSLTLKQFIDHEDLQGNG
jgi:UDP-N-acetylglucosamine 2-epimerase (non-hydrolysing)/GDP/UDP-N,N'-diacetylbacillosamine 2-epimerase (hydrolysing)